MIVLCNMKKSIFQIGVMCNNKIGSMCGSVLLKDDLKIKIKLSQ